jgi:hypothetical protein
MNEAQRRSSIDELIARLTEWEVRYGITYPPNEGLVSTGESTGQINELKRQLVDLGAVFHWDGKGYVLDRVEQPGRGRQNPDAVLPRRPDDQPDPDDQADGDA